MQREVSSWISRFFLPLNSVVFCLSPRRNKNEPHEYCKLSAFFASLLFSLVLLKQRPLRYSFGWIFSFLPKWFGFVVEGIFVAVVLIVCVYVLAFWGCLGLVLGGFCAGSFVVWLPSFVSLWFGIVLCFVCLTFVKQFWKYDIGGQLHHIRHRLCQEEHLSLIS